MNIAIWIFSLKKSSISNRIVTIHGKMKWNFLNNIFNTLSFLCEKCDDIIENYTLQFNIWLHVMFYNILKCKGFSALFIVILKRMVVIYNACHACHDDIIFKTNENYAFENFLKHVLLTKKIRIKLLSRLQDLSFIFIYLFWISW